MWDFVAQKDAQTIEEEKEALTVEPREENETKFDMIPDLEIGEYEQMQSHPSGDTEIFLDQSHSPGYIEVTQEQPQ